MARTKNTQAETVEAIEPDQPEGVITAEAQAEQPAAQYSVQWHIKVNGQRFAPGDVVELDAATAEPFLASGAIQAQQ